MKYVILENSEVGSIDFNQVKEDSSDTLCYNITGTKTFVKFEGDVPSFLDGKTEYTHSEILTILDGEEWQSDE